MHSEIPAYAPLERLRRFGAEATATIKRVCGMPDYPRYRRHMAERHPGGPVLTEREFFEAHVNARYGNGASRCC